MASPVNSKKHKVLIVDDTKDVRVLLKAYLEAEGLQVMEASTGHEAIQMLRNDHDIKLMLLDLMMPGMDGFTTLEHLSDERKHRNIRICFVTGKADVKYVLNAIDLGVQDYIIKPFDRKLLVAKVQSLLSDKPVNAAQKKSTSFKAVVLNCPFKVDVRIGEITENMILLETRIPFLDGAVIELFSENLNKVLKLHQPIACKVGKSIEANNGRYFTYVNFFNLPEASLNKLRNLINSGFELKDEDF